MPARACWNWGAARRTQTPLSVIGALRCLVLLRRHDNVGAGFATCLYHAEHVVNRRLGGDVVKLSVNVPSLPTSALVSGSPVMPLSGKPMKADII